MTPNHLTALISAAVFIAISVVWVCLVLNRRKP